MATDTGVIELQPGVDSEKHDQNLQQGVASTLSDAVGTQINPKELTPVSNQHPVNIPTEEPGLEPKPSTSVEELMDAEKGKPRWDASKNFFRVWLDRRKKQNPGKVLEPEK